MNPIERTSYLFRTGDFNCAQAILTVFGEPFGLTSERARAIGRVLGGGIARSAGMCGYLAGALLILSLALDEADEPQARKQTFATAERLLTRFRHQYHTLECKQLLGVDLSTEAGRRQAADEQLTARRCPEIGEMVARILLDLLSER